MVLPHYVTDVDPILDLHIRTVDDLFELVDLVKYPFLVDRLGSDDPVVLAMEISVLWIAEIGVLPYKLLNVVLFDLQALFGRLHTNGASCDYDKHFALGLQDLCVQVLLAIDGFHYLL